MTYFEFYNRLRIDSPFIFYLLIVMLICIIIGILTEN
jgi:hypothetical protein